MRIFIFVFVVSILSSCGMLGVNQGHLRYVKVDQKEIPIIDKSSNDRTQNDRSVENSTIAQNSSIELESLENQQAIETTKTSDAKFLDHETKNSDKSLIQSNVNSAEDDEEIAAQAFQAEKRAGASLFLSAAGLISIFIPFIGIIPFIIGIVFFSKASASRYITQFGQSRLNASKVFLIIDSIFLIAWIILVVAIFFF